MLTPNDKDKINAFVRDGKKIEAVKYLRDRFDLSLKDATELLSYHTGEKSTDASVLQQTLNKVDEQKVRLLVRSGNVIDAIKLVQQQKNCSLKEAKAYVDQYSNKTGIKAPTSTGWLPTLNVFTIFRVLGSILIVVSAYLWWQDYQFYKNSVIVKGTVISLQYASADHQSGAAPVVEYTWRGKKQTLVGDTYSNPPAVKTGEQLEVIVSQRDDGQAKINILSERYFVILMFGILGSIFFAIGFIARLF